MNTTSGNQRGIGGMRANSNCNNNTGGIETASGSVATTVKATKIRTTITSDPGILCFHHCNVKVFCFTLPHICPQCKTPLDTQQTTTNGKKTTTNTKAKMKKRTTTTNTNEKSIGNTKGQNQHNNRIVLDNKYEADDPLNDNNGNKDRKKDDEDHNNADDDDDDDDAIEDDDDDDNEDFDSTANSLVSHIMATRLLPFRLPYPFVRANQYPCAVVLRPTTGDFLNDYNNTTDLHIAVTTSTGCVVEFDRHGLRRHRTDNMSDWCQSLLVGDVPEPWYDYWDQILFEICQQADKWTVAHYHEDKHNCYTFVLNFLQALTYDKLSEAAKSKTTFCEKYIVPRTTTAGKYISLYRKLRDTGIYVHHTNHYNNNNNSNNNNKLRHLSSYAKGGNKYQHQQHQQQQQQHQFHHQQYSNKLNNSTIVVATAKTVVHQQRHHHQQQQQQQQQHLQKHQQKQHHHSNHHYSIIARPHSTLCTIEE